MSMSIRRKKAGSRIVFSEQQIDMRDISAFMPEVVEIVSSIDRGANSKAKAFFWSDLGVEQLKEMLLIESVRSILDKRCSLKTWDDVITWMMSEDEGNPFSFRRCCIDVMYAEPERYRSAVINLVRSRNPKFIDQLH